MIELDRLSKRFGSVTALDALSFTVRPGHVTGFLGPNGAGKTTTMKIILGLDAPSAGTALVNGSRYDRLIRPLHQVGSLLDATALHGGRTARLHLASIARSNGIGRRRVAEVLAADRHGGGGGPAGQRVLARHEAAARPGRRAARRPARPDAGRTGQRPGHRGHRLDQAVLQALAGEGRTVLVSSHLMSEMALTADHLIVIGRGKLLADMPTAQLIAANARHDVLLRSPRAAELAGLLTARGATVTPQHDGALVVTGLDAAAIGDLAASHGIAVHALVPRQASLEDAYLDLTGETVDYQGTRP